MIRAFSGILILVTMGMIAFAQPKKDEGQYTKAMGWRAYVIGDGTIEGADKKVHIGPPHPTKEAAEQDVARWKAENPKSFRLPDVEEVAYYAPLKQPNVRKDSNDKAPTIATPSVKSADPGPLKKPEPKVPSLAGRKGSGKLGDTPVQIEFVGQENKGTFTVYIDGKKVGEGDWVQLGPNVIMKSENWTYSGKIDDNKLSGERKRRMGDEQKENWSITFDPPEKPSPDIGTWTLRGDGYTWVFELKSGNVGKHTNVPDIGESEGGPITWRRQGDELKFKFRPDGDDWTLKFSDMKKTK